MDEGLISTYIPVQPKLFGVVVVPALGIVVWNGRRWWW
jgi:hypothetical protein